MMSLHPRDFQTRIVNRGIELSFSLIFCYLFFCFYSYFTKAAFPLHDIDSAGMVQLLQNVAKGNGLVSSIFSSIYDLLPLLPTNVADFENSTFSSVHSETSFFQWHAYLIAYPVVVPIIMGAEATTVAISAVVASMTFSIVAPAYWVARKSDNALLGILFLICAFNWVPWNNALFGQLYFDRLFLGTQTLLIFTSFTLLINPNSHRAISGLMWLSAIAGCLISERTSLMVGCYFIGLIILYWGPLVKNRAQLFQFGVLAVIPLMWVLFYTNLYYDSPYAATTSLTAIFRNVTNFFDPSSKYFTDSVMLFLTVLPFSILSMFNLRFGLLCVLTVIPNFLVSVGGAEKIGFTTHYHMMYVPFLIAGGAIGLVSINKWITRSGRSKSKNSIVIMALLLVFVWNLLLSNKSWSGGQAFEAANPFVPVSTQTKNLDEIAATLKDLDAAGALKISAHSSAMPALVNLKNTVFFAFPVGIYDVDYLLVQYIAKESDYKPVVDNYLPNALEGKTQFIEKIIGKDFDLLQTQSSKPKHYQYRLYQRR
ncbi:MAG: hypothetical protein CBC29_04880 [Methylococcaceae bacterium TMED69]|nr:MAG: hypothetical protein CBC29_04880 [Methylococcaceae bacterium TMED69]